MVPPVKPVEEKRRSDVHNRDGDTRNGDLTAMGDTRATRDLGDIGIGVSSKRTAGNAGLNEGGEGVPRLGKV